MPAWYMEVRVGLLFLQSFLGVLVFGYSLPRRNSMVKTALYLLAGGVVCHLFGRLVYCLGDDVISILRRICSTIMVYLVLILVVWLVFRISIWSCLFVTSSGYMAQDIAGNIKTIAKLFDGVNQLAQHPVGILLVDFICYGGVFGLLFLLFYPYTKHREENFNHKLKAIFSVVVLVLCICMARITFDNPVRNQLSIFAESLYGVICGILLLLVQFGIMDKARFRRREHDILNILHLQQEHFEKSKTDLSFIHQKYHDLKASLRQLEPILSEKERVQLERSVAKHLPMLKTGNPILDLLLTETQSLCNLHQIEFTYLLNGQDFDFLQELELYTLLNNALTNALQAAQKLPKDAPKFIHLTAHRSGGLLSIHLENSFDGILSFSEGLPRTAKDPRYHGFGMKSMRSIAEKYNGSLTAHWDENRFHLDLLLFTPH